MPIIIDARNAALYKATKLRTNESSNTFIYSLIPNVLSTLVHQVWLALLYKRTMNVIPQGTNLLILECQNFCITRLRKMEIIELELQGIFLFGLSGVVPEPAC